MAAVAALSGCNKEPAAEAPKEVALDSEVQKVSYIVGYDIASRMTADDFTPDSDAFMLGMKENIASGESRFNEEQARQIMTDFQAESQKRRQEKLEKEGAENAEKGKAFLDENAKKEGVVVTESGLQYKEVVAGEGEKPKAEDTVVVHYSGKLLDGTEFDSSYARGEPATFPVGSLIPGWVEALQLMNVGDKWELYIPSELAYGPGSTGGIPANSTLIFEMELLEINPQSESPEEETAESEGE